MTDTSHNRIYNNITELVGQTPMVRLSSLRDSLNFAPEICAKLEYLSPMSSVKDRIGLAMIEAMERSGQVNHATTIIEPTSGNTGIALAFVCASRGYRLILCMPANMSSERKRLLALLGAELRLTDPELGMAGAIAQAQKLTRETDGAIMPQQFKNPANPAIHAATTANEIWNDCSGKIDAIVGGVGTGGTLTGIGRTLKKRLPNLKIIAVEPENSPVLSGGKPGPHMLQGIGAGFIPEVLETELLDEVICVGNYSALAMIKLLARTEGLAVGISSGAALAAATEYAARSQPNAESNRIVVIFPSAAERYLSTPLFNEL